MQYHMYSHDNIIMQALTGSFKFQKLKPKLPKYDTCNYAVLKGLT